MKPTYCIILLTTLSMSLISADAVAKRGIRFGKGIKGATTKTYTADTLTVSQLAACLKREDTIDSSALQLEQSEQVVNQRTETLNKLDSELDKLTQSIENTDTSSLSTQYAVDAYNQKVDDYNAQLNKRNGLFEDYEQVRIAYNSEVNQHNTLVSDFDLWCAGKRYYEDDMAEALRMANAED